MSKKDQAKTRRLITVLGSSGFFKLVMLLLIAQAAWIALSGRYPMAFDEDFHLGIIRLYAHHISPFWSQQPAGADAYGAVARDPSYLYQYLMSYPYRLISLFTSNQAAQVLALRFVNIGLFAGALPLYRRALLKTGASRALVHACLAVFILIPVVPFLAAQINYDNLLLPLTALSLLLAMDFSENLRHRRKFDIKDLVYLISFCLLASLVKYAFLPLAIAIAVFVAVRLWQTYRGGDFWRELGLGWSRLSLAARGLLILTVAVSTLLFSERYVVNLVRYQNPVPDCAKVLTVKQCSAYGPWIRDYNFMINKVDIGATKGPVAFMADWLYGMWLRLFFTVDGPATLHQTRGPLLVPGVSAIIFTIVSGVAVIVAAAKRLFNRYDRAALWLFGLTAASYVGALWLDEFRAFLRTGQPVAINGRYLFPVLPPLLLIGALACAELLRRRQTAKLLLAAVALLCMLWGGGALTYVLRSNDAWYWSNSVILTANHTIQKTIGPVTPGFYNQTQFLR